MNEADRQRKEAAAYEALASIMATLDNAVSVALANVETAKERAAKAKAVLENELSDRNTENELEPGEVVLERVCYALALAERALTNVSNDLAL